MGSNLNRAFSRIWAKTTNLLRDLFLIGAAMKYKIEKNDDGSEAIYVLDPSLHFKIRYYIDKIVGGWLVQIANSEGLTFIPDSRHKNKPVPADMEEIDEKEVECMRKKRDKEERERGMGF